MKSAPRFFRPKRTTYDPRRPPKPQVVTTTRHSALAQTHQISALREAVVIATILKTPACLEALSVALEDVTFSRPDYEQMRGFLASYIGDPAVLMDAMRAGFGQPAIDALFALPHMPVAPSIRRADDVEFATMCLLHEVRQIAAPKAHADEVADSEHEIADQTDESLTWRIAESKKTLDAVKRGPEENSDDFITADNGASVSVNEKEAWEALVNQLGFTKSKG